MRIRKTLFIDIKSPTAWQLLRGLTEPGEGITISSKLGEDSSHLASGLTYVGWFAKANDYEITFVGHSKGGGEAAVNAEFWNRNAIVFNPSIPDIIWALADQGYVKPYVVSDEILNYYLGEIPLLRC